MIQSARKRKKAFEQKTSQLFKKADELSVLCGTDIGIIISNPDDKGIVSWPSHETAKERFIRYMNSSAIDRTRKMETQESFLLEEMEKLKQNLQQRKKIIAEKEAEFLLHQIRKHKNMHEVGWTELDNLYLYTSEKLERFEKRIETTAKENQGQPTVRETRDQELAMENLDENQWDNFPTLEEAGSIMLP